MTVHGIPSADVLLLVVDDHLGRRIGEVETLADPFAARVHRDLDWLCRTTGCARGDAWREIWQAWRGAAA